MELKNPTRTEALLANIAGYTGVPVPDMKNATRSEILLKEILDNGGGGGGVTPEYVAEAIAEAKTDIEAEIPTKTSDLTNDSGYAAINDTTVAQDKTYSSAKVEEKVAGEEITATATGSNLTLSTSEGNLNTLIVYGKSEVANENIMSAGEGWGTVDLGAQDWTYVPNALNYPIFSTTINDVSFSTTPLFCEKYVPKTNRTQINGDLQIARWNNSSSKEIVVTNFNYTDATVFKNAMSGVLLCYELADISQGNAIAVKTDDGTGIDGTMAVFETGTPLRGTLDGTTRDEMRYNGITGEVITRCEIVNDEVVPLTTPIITPLTAQEMTALAGLRAFAPSTHAQNNAGASMLISAPAGTANGKAIADLRSELKITQSDTLTLTVAGWSNNTQTVSYTHDTAKRNVIDVDLTSIEEWANCGVLATAETASGITFSCKTVPTNALTFRVTSMGV